MSRSHPPSQKPQLRAPVPGSSRARTNDGPGTSPRLRTKSSSKPSTVTVSSRSPDPPGGSSISAISNVPTRVSSTNAGAVLSPRARTKSTPRSPAKAVPGRSLDQPDSTPVRTNVNIREAIALKRAEAKRSASKGIGNGLQGLESQGDALPTADTREKDEDVIDLGRWSVKQTIERARSTGSINLSSRSLPCLPSALFEIHLGITPNPLNSVTHEPPIETSAHHGLETKYRQQPPSWFEAQDLLTLKAWNNEIVEIQPEIHLFGSLKILDLHQNKIRSLPDAFADLGALTSLDLSHNEIGSLPTNIFTLPCLTYLNISHNALKALPFASPFSDPSFQARPSHSQDTFFAPVITRASVPLPSLLTLNVSNNKIPACAVDHGPTSLPRNLSKFDISGNPLTVNNSECKSLLQALAKLKKLKEVCLANTGIGVGELAPDLLSTLSDDAPFSALELMDFGGTDVTVDIARAALSAADRALSFGDTNEKTKEGVIRVVVTKGTRELDTGRRGRARTTKVDDPSSETQMPTIPETSGVEKPKATIATTAAPAAAHTAETPPVDKKSAGYVSHTQRTIVKEAWEIEAEQGLLTEGGRRRARIMAAAAAKAAEQASSTGVPRSDADSNASPPPLSLWSSQYYSAATQALTLPPSAPLPKSPSHSRTLSLAVPSSNPLSTTRTMDVAIPAPTLPLAVITTQPFAPKLKTLILANRRLDRSFNLPCSADGSDGSCLPNLEELSLEGCGLADTVSVSRRGASGTGDALRSTEPLIPLLTRLFPSLRTLDVSYNLLTSASLTTDVLTTLILSSSGDEDRFPRKGLKHLRLRGNKIGDLDGFKGVAEFFKGNREVPAWKLDELDLRDNEIQKLPPELGLMPLDVFLVDGNIFRVPQRRIWEREGTKGLLSWLRGRIE